MEKDYFIEHYRKNTHTFLLKIYIIEHYRKNINNLILNESQSG